MNMKFNKKGLTWQVLGWIIISLIGAVLLISFLISLKNGKLPAMMQNFFDFMKFGG